MIRFGGFFRSVALLMMLTAVSCNVHQWPDAPEREKFALKLVFDTDFTQRGYTYDGGSTLTASGTTTETESVRSRGYMHHIVRAYPKIDGVSQLRYYDEFEFTRSVALGYDCDLTVELTPGEYTVRVWSELLEREDGRSYYDSDDFGEIRLWGAHAANTDYRDAFRGTVEIEVESYVSAHVADKSWITMERPLAKYEFVATDLSELLQTSGGSAEDYEAVVTYPSTSYMPCAYSMYIDKPVDSSTGVVYRSALSRLSASETSLGFDYVFVNGGDASVTVRIDVCRKSTSEAVWSSPAIQVPLRRSEHTVIRGAWFTKSDGSVDGSGGVHLDPGYEGENNTFIPLN